jgi:phytoene dehydrogenase-like protein
MIPRWKHLREQVLSDLETRFLPGLREKRRFTKAFTPVHFEHELRGEAGSAFSFEPRLFQTAAFRPGNANSEVDGLYFVGAGTQPGAGIPGVILSTRMTVDAIYKRAGVDNRHRSLMDWVAEKAGQSRGTSLHLPPNSNGLIPN